MDLSDGLADAVAADRGGVGHRRDHRRGRAADPGRGARVVPARRPGSRSTSAVAGGDDYELLFAVPRRARGRLATVIRQARGIPITRIGRLTKEPATVLVRNGVAEPLPQGFVHF